MIYSEVDFLILGVQVCAHCARRMRASKVKSLSALNLFVLLSVARGHFVGAHTAMRFCFEPVGSRLCA